MPIEASFPKPMVVEPRSGVHKHTIILLHGRGGSANLFGPALLNTSIPSLADQVGGGRAAGHGKEQAVITADLLPAVGHLVVEPPTSTIPSSDVAPDDTQLSTGTPRSQALAPGQETPRGTSDQDNAPHRRRDAATTLAEALPHARFVFPNAPRQRATVYRRSIMRQWFDDWHLRPGLSGDLVDHRYDEGLQTSGLGETIRYLHSLVATEADLVGGVGNVVLGGISQGCAASLVAALLWEGDERLGAVVGMCGWLPYVAQMKEAMQDQAHSAAGGTGQEGDDFEVFERSASPLTSPSVTGPVGAALSWLRDELELPGSQSSGPLGAESRKPPIVLCHGRDDKSVDRYQGQAAAEFLLSLGMEVRGLRVYDRVGHEYSEEMLADILDFLQSVLPVDAVTS